MAHALGANGVRETASDEVRRDLVVEIAAVRDDDQGRVLVRGIAAQLERQPEHAEALAAPLCVPDDAAAIRGLPRHTGARDRLVDGLELLVPANLADDAPGILIALEDDEVLEQVEEIVRREQARDRDVLGAGGVAQEGCQVGLIPRPR